MITLTGALENFMQGQDLKGLKPFAYLFRNKWVAYDESESESAESGAVGGKYVLDTTPIDITPLIVKPNTLSMTLDVNEVAQYNANNVTLTLSDTHNYFVEGTPESYFPAGYQLYGSRVVLYYGIDTTNRTAIFTGRIKELPTYKPEQYQVELKLVSHLEMLKDIEAKDFSDKVIGEELNFVRTEEQKRIYETAGTGVGGFDAIYADGAKLYEGIDYELDQMNALNLPAVVTIIKEDYEHATITADYYTWKTGLSVEQIIAGLVGLAGYNSESEDIRNVVWNTEIRTQQTPDDLFTLGYRKQGGLYSYAGAGNYCYGASLPPRGDADCTNIFPENFVYELIIASTPALSLGLAGQTTLRIGGNDKYFLFSSNHTGGITCVYIDGETSSKFNIFTTNENRMRIKKVGNTYSFYGVADYYPDPFFTVTADIDLNVPNNIRMVNENYSYAYPILNYQKLTDLDSGIELENYGIALSSSHQDITTWVDVDALKSDDSVPTTVRYRTTNDGTAYSEWSYVDIGADLGVSSKTIQFTIELNDNSLSTNFTNTSIFYLGQELTISLVNLSGKSVLEALQDFALISGYEFGVDRQGVFFFRPRVASTTPTYILGHDEIVKVDTVKKNLSDLFTKLTLNFAQIPLEFYANDGPRPNAIDKYGVINKEIDKPDIVNYDNPELAQAIGPQLLAIYADLSNILQVTGKLNLSLELGDIVNLKRNYNLVQPDSASDLKKYAAQQTYYRACKITGMNYNFAKRQITYTLRDVSNANNGPLPPYLQFTYEFPLPFGAKQ